MLVSRTARNAACNALAWAIPVVLGLLFTPYIVRNLGHDEYGVLTIVWSVVGYFTFLDLGLGHAVTKFVAEHNARREPVLVEDVVGTSLLLTILLGLAGGSIVAVLARPLATRWLNVPPHLVQDVKLALCFSGAGLFLGMLQNVLKAIPDGHSRYDISSAVAIAFSCTCTLGSVLMLSCGASLLHIVLLNVAAPLIGIAANAYAAKRLSPQLSFRPTLRPSVLRKVVHFGLFTLLSRVAFVCMRHLDRIIIAALLGISSVTYYAIPVMLAGRISALTQRTGVVIFPAVSALQGKSQPEMIAELYTAASRLILTLSAAICLPLVFFGPQFLALWMDADFAANAGTVMVLVTVASLVDATTAPPTFVLNGIGRPRIPGVSAIIHATLFLLLIRPFALWLGISGVAWALLISNLVIAPLYTAYATYVIPGVSWRALLVQAFARPVCALAITSVALAAIPATAITSLPLLLLMMGGAFLLYLVVALLCGVFRTEELDRAVACLKRLTLWQLATRRNPT